MLLELGTVASLLAKLQLIEKEKELIFKHFGRPENINKNKYQPAGGSLQLQTKGKRLQEIHQESGKAPAPKVMIHVCYCLCDVVLHIAL